MIAIGVFPSASVCLFWRDATSLIERFFILVLQDCHLTRRIDPIDNVQCDTRPDFGISMMRRTPFRRAH
jgi:hypothetical protein